MFLLTGTPISTGQTISRDLYANDWRLIYQVNGQKLIPMITHNKYNQHSLVELGFETWTSGTLSKHMLKYDTKPYIYPHNFFRNITIGYALVNVYI